MSEQTKIEWATSTGNPWIGCTKVSPGCAGCYAAELDRTRFSRTMGGGTKDKPISHWGKGAPRVRTKGFWKDAVRWNREADGKDRIVCSDCSKKRGLEELCKQAAIHTFAGMGDQSNCSLCGKPNGGASIALPRPRIFPSLCDVWDEEVPIEWLADYLKLVFDTPNLDHLMLTKRPENFGRVRESLSAMKECPADFETWILQWEDGDPPENVWIGTSVEDQERADKRIPWLSKIPAKVRFLSAEPLLGPIQFRTPADLLAIDWVIVGGESGPNARHCNIEWVRSIVKQCAAASNMACFVKQLGSLAAEPAKSQSYPSDNTVALLDLKHPKGGDPSEWPDDLRVRQFP